MLLFKKKPTTPSLRHTLLIRDSGLVKSSNPLRSKTFVKHSQAGRNNDGRITVYTKGGGHKRRYRKVDFQRKGLRGIIESVEYDPNRSARIARVFSWETNTHTYILACEKLKRGNIVNDFSLIDKKKFSLKIGNSYCLDSLPLGSYVHNISFSLDGLSSIARAGGTFAQLIAKDSKFCRLRLRSGEERNFLGATIVTLGVVSNPLHRFKVLGKAGRSRWLGRRPSVRGVAMNPVDHPHGGGEGKTSGGRPSVTPWGKVAKGQPTRKKSKKKLKHG